MNISLFNSLKFRMPLVVLGGVLPLILVAIYIASDHAAKTIRQEAKENLIIKTKTLAESVSRWEESNILALGTLTEQPDIVSMNPEQQKPVLDTIANNYKHIYLAHTVDQNGWIMARSDEKKPGGYRADRTWFKNPMSGADLTRQLLISRTIEQPALCLSAPIRTDKLNILGVTAICSDLQALTQQVGQLKFGETGYAFIVDESGSVLAHPDPKYLSGSKLKDVSYYPPVKHFLAGNTGDNIFNFFDEVNWISYQVPLNNGWGVIVVQQKAEFLKSEQDFKNLAFFIAGVAVITVSFVTSILANHLIAPITNLTNAATAIASGKFEKKITINRQDELGILANAFNKMKANLKNLFASLEHRIEIRTAELKEAKDAAEQSSAIALAANQSKDRFIANISHELLTPLHSIIGYNRLVQQDKNINLTYSKHLKVVEKSSVHLLSLISDLLDISQSRLNQITLNPTNLKLESFLNEVIEMMSMQAEEKNIILQHEYNDLPQWIKIDEKRLRQILVNLLNNAIKFTERGKVTLKVTSVPSNSNNHDSLSRQKLRFSIIDNGIGMTREDLKKIFKPFEQAGNIKSNNAGVGLGLSVVSELVKLMGGQLRVKSHLGIGSIFWVDIIVPVLAKNQEIEPKILPSNIAMNRAIKPKVLVVDDKEVNRKLLIEILAPKGFEIFTAENGDEMFKIAENIQPNIILLDLFMPVKTGFTTAKELRQNPNLKHIPIIVVTASLITQEMSAYLDCEAVLYKPIDEDKLLTVLNQYLSQSVI